MKKSLVFIFGIFLIGSLIFIGSCKTDGPEPEGGTWTNEDKQSHDQVINTQDEVAVKLDEWFQTMDSLDAINQAYQAFASSENVNSATINDQGIAVQYSNGMIGGILLNPLDGKDEVGEPLVDGPVTGQENNLKSLVNQQKMILINPHYWERSYYTDQIHTITNNNLGKVGMEISTFYKNEEATVDRFTDLSGYGIIQIYSHGWAYPKKTNITEVYLLTGEAANESTSKKYWDELKTGNIPIVKVAGRQNHYLVSPEFITNHNDFSNDTILFFGGFCYSFLGGWPDIIDNFGDGAYTGYDWSVYTHKNANWSVNSIFNLSDTTADQPITLNDWFNDPEVPKSYFNARDNRTVNIHYAGDGNLKLWDDVSVSLVPLSADGTPVNNPGEAGTAYPFRCSVNTNISPLEYIWDIGDGSSPVSASNEVNITWSEEGQYELKVDVRDKNNGNIIGTDKVNVTIGDSGEEELIDFVKKCTYVSMSFGPESAFIWEEGKTMAIRKDPGDLEWEYAPIVWNGLNFSATLVTDDNSTQTINGSVSSDGYMVSAAGEQEGQSGTFYTFTYNLAFENYPVELPHENTLVQYHVESSLVQNYVTNFEGQMLFSNGHIVNYTGVDWAMIERLYISFHWLPVTSAVTDLQSESK